MLRRVLNLVFSRIVVTGVLLLLQAFWLFALFYWLADYAKWFGGVGVAMSIIMCLALIRQDSTVPEFKISWIILFAVMPVQGGILFHLAGRPTAPLFSTPFPFLKEKRKWGRKKGFSLQEKEKNGVKRVYSVRRSSLPVMASETVQTR